MGNEISHMKRQCMIIEDERNALQALEEEDTAKTTGEVSK
jgi:hypothetical protein